MKRPAFLLACILSLAAGASAKPIALQVEATGAPQLMLRGKDARQQLLVTAKLHDGVLRDFTHKAHYAASPAGIVKVDSDGVVGHKRAGGVVLSWSSNACSNADKHGGVTVSF